MKSVLSTLAILVSVSAFAVPSLESTEQALYTPQCVDFIPTAAGQLANYSSANQKVVIHNLNFYKTIVGTVIANIDRKQSNTGMYAAIAQMLAKHKETYAGKAVAWCIEDQVTFKGTPVQQKQQALKAMAIIDAAMKAAI